MKILCVFGQHNYGQPTRGESYEYVNFPPAFKRLGCEVVFFDSWNRSLYVDFSELNRTLLETIQTEQPDVVFCVLLGYEIWLETLDIIKKSGVTLINWGTDDSWKYSQFSRFISSSFHYYLTTSLVAFDRAKEARLGNWVLTQWAASRDSLENPVVAADCIYPVAFIGSAYGNRPQWIKRLKSLGVEVFCFGYGWPNGPVTTEEMRKIIRNSNIVLNFGDSGLHMKGLSIYRDRQIKARIFEVPGGGGFLMTENADRLNQYFEVGEELIVFSDAEDLAHKIRYFLSHSDVRDQVANQGHQRVRSEHTYEVRFSKIFDHIRASGDQMLPTGDVVIDWSVFEHVVLLHRPTSWMLMTRSALVWLCELIWGAPRGARAARRIMYEVSWRLWKRKTYTSMSFPGRLFYLES